MRRLTILVLALAAIYSTYWFVGTRTLESTANSQVAQMLLEGWALDFDNLETHGYPSRFDTTVSGLDLLTPSGDYGVKASFVQALSLSYKPNEVILVMPDRQDVTIGGVPLTVSSDGLRASAAVAVNTDLDLTRFTAEVGQMSIDGAVGSVLSLSNALVALRPAAEPLSYDVFADIDDLALPVNLRQILDPASNFPPALSQFTIDVNVTTDRKLDRHVLDELKRPQVEAFKLNGMTLAWGSLSLRGTGEVTIDGAGIPTGKITLEAQSWREMLQMAVNAGVVDSGVSRTLENMGSLWAGGSMTLSLPISFQNGMMLIGPVPAGPAPRFR